jgi:excisionase family DNA binding protein
MLQRKYLTVKEVSQYIGVATDTIYTMVNQRRIPYVKVGRLVKFDQAALDAWLKQNTVMPMPRKTY